MKLVRPTEAGARGVLCPAERSLAFFSRREEPLGFQRAQVLRFTLERLFLGSTELVRLAQGTN